jgi:hypothetical protein
MYDPRHNYCGPESWPQWLKFPRRLFGVDINWHCYAHDEAWHKGERMKAADEAFRDGIRLDFIAANKPNIGLVVAYGAYGLVRAGRFIRWLRGQ